MNWTLVICCSVAVVAAFLVHGSGAQTGVGLGGPCQNASQCTNSTPNSTTCSGGKCSCADGYQVSNNNKTCTLKLNETCGGSKICNQMGATCYAGKCTCISGYVFSSNGTACLEAAKELYGGFCNDTNQCRNLDNAMCDIMCICRPGFTYASSTRCKSAPSCTNQCQNNYQCTGGHCSCTSSTVDINGYCRKLVKKLGSSCDEKIEVCYESNKGISNVECKKKICTCIKGSPNQDKTACNGATSSVLASTGLLLFAFIMSRIPM